MFADEVFVAFGALRCQPLEALAEQLALEKTIGFVTLG